tara:strand:+ start:285 stop:476 length:192 start_codon:yes stop_codon:yes gene_type:complete
MFVKEDIGLVILLIKIHILRLESGVSLCSIGNFDLNESGANYSPSCLFFEENKTAMGLNSNGK